MEVETQRPTKASGVAVPAAAEPMRAGEKRRNRWDQGVSSECAPVPHVVRNCGVGLTRVILTEVDGVLHP